MADYAYYAFDVVSGDITGELPLIGASPKWAINDSGDLGSVSIPLNPLSNVERALIREITTPIRTGMAVAREGQIIWAGWTKARRYSGGVYTYTVPGILAYWSKRLVTTTLSWDGADQFQIVRDLLSFGPPPSIPLVLGSTLSGISRQREIPGSDLATVLDQILEISDNINGFEIAVQSSNRVGTLTSGVVHTLLLGSPALGGNFGTTVGLALEVPGNARDLSWDEDGEEFVTDLWGSSETDEGVSLVRSTSSTEFTELGWPVVMDKTDFSNVSNVDTMDDHLAAALETRHYFTNSPTLTVDDEGDTAAGQWTIGDLARLRVTDDLRFARADDSPAPGLDTIVRIQEATLDPSGNSIAITLSTRGEAI